LKHIDHLRELSHIEHTLFPQNMDANLPDAGAHFAQGLPIRGIQSSLNETQLESGSTPGFCRKRSKIIQAGADELQRLHDGHYISLFIMLSIENHDEMP
jgi:hypothetical protein